ncbi:Por secretion system C-terminal sorting domain-containing protein [Marivirga sericea]|uniref:Por secretion system C-terminal sorting domain-containing protein n=1 Tax=Marivirga sericea TaxID=1028 RepID=A0A1X7ISZ6_9BACT|nr:T9SS type A sorting domain-containing protein [Marivirga sericea]SMG17990.1 Por secretion system C-terminal sorting domain-containing protein [Marivirga sericea]
MKTAKLLKLYFIGFLLIYFSPSQAQIQERPISHLQKNQSSTQRTAITIDTLSLPLWEDFSYKESQPDSSIWLYGENIFVNSSYAHLPPSINVASLDGFNGQGQPYDPDASNNGIGDSLVSQPIDLSGFTVNSNINLSFFWQPGYGGFAPDQQDSLKISFKNSEGNWIQVGGFRGNGNIEPLLFSQHFERVNDTSFLHAGFQFKFEIAGNLAGDFDLWNIDYIYLNEGNTPVGTQENAYDSYEDRTFSRKAGTPFGNYFAIPLHHLEEEWLTQNLHSSDFIYNNLWAGNANNFSFGTEFFSIVYDTLKAGSIIDSLDVDGIFLTDLQDTARFTYKVKNKTQFIDYLIAEKNVEDSVYLNFQFNLGTNDSLFFETVNGVAQYYPDLSFRQNDTISTIIPLHDFYAYDDGTAESRIQLNSRNYLLAQGYEMIGEQYLTGIELYAPNIGQNSSTQNITLLVWNELTANTDDILRAQNVLINESTSINQFQRFSFDRPVLLKGEFFIGYREENDEPLSIGFDKSTNSADKLFYNQSGTWEPNTVLEGSVMIRPVFDEARITVSNEKVLDTDWRIKAYPNPNKGLLKLTENWDQIKIYDLQGRLRLESSNPENLKELDISKLENDLYLLKIMKGSKQSILKIMLRK